LAVECLAGLVGGYGRGRGQLLELVDDVLEGEWNPDD
jgi:hypothetical protein